MIFAALLYLVLSWPLLRVCLHRSLWTWFPRTLLWAALTWWMGLALTTSVAIHRPAGLPVLLLCLLTVRLWHQWRSRAEYGTGQRLPPGSLAVLDPKPWTEPDYYLKLAEQHGPIFKVCHLLAPMLCIADLRLAWEFLEGQAENLESPPLRFNALLPGGSLRYMGPEAHRHYRNILGSGLSGAVLADCEPYLESAVQSALLHLNADHDPRMTMDALTQEVMLGVIHGARPHEARYRELTRLYRQLDVAAVERDFLPWKPRSGSFLQALHDASEQLLIHPEGPIARSIEARHPGALADPVVRANLAMMVDVGSRDLAGLLTWILWMLAHHPDGQQTPVSLVSQTLRLEQSEYLYRRTTRKIDWRGFEIPKGWLVRACVWEAHRRTLGQPGESDCRPFGARPHSCLGQTLTRRLCTLFVERLLLAHRVRLVSDGPREFDGWHWRPSSRFRIQLTTPGDIHRETAL